MASLMVLMNAMVVATVLLLVLVFLDMSLLHLSLLIANLFVAIRWLLLGKNAITD